MAAGNVNVVLAHGAWADGSSWARVIAILKAEGVNVVAAPLPLTSLADDVAALDRSLARVEGPVVLVGHAYAGAVIAETRSKQVKALVYVTALAPAGAETRARQQRPDLAARGGFQERVRAGRRHGGPRGALGRAAADLAGLHHGAREAPALEGCAELVPGRGRRPHDFAGDAALHGRAHEGEGEGAHGRSRPDRHRAACRRRNHS